MDFRFNIFRCDRGSELTNLIEAELAHYLDLFPSSKSARILLKPNLNSNMNALTGNTTDLRLLAAVISFLQNHGYRNIAIGEGTNSGFYRNKINVITRLMIDNLAQQFGVELIDLNYADGVPVEFDLGTIAYIAQPCVTADFLINIPKLKTHFEVGMTGCLKNLMGCLVGQENKKKTHQNLTRNILNLNKQLKPQLHIMDGLIAMEGTGPTRGTPKKVGLVLIGTDPYLLDLAAANIAGFTPHKLRLLHAAEQAGYITSEYHRFLLNLPISNFAIPGGLREPKVNPLVAFIHHPKRQKYFLRIRQTAFFTALCQTTWVGQLLFWSGLRQDKFLGNELNCDKIYIVDSCTNCKKCREYCPMHLPLPEALKPDSTSGIKSQCIKCMYCYMVCPERAIAFDGEPGFFAEQQRQYDDIVRKIT